MAERVSLLESLSTVLSITMTTATPFWPPELVVTTPQYPTLSGNKTLTRQNAATLITTTTTATRHVIKHDTRYEKRETKIKYSFFGLFCTINQLTRFNSNHLCVYLVKQGLCHIKKLKIEIFELFSFWMS